MIGGDIYSIREEQAHQPQGAVRKLKQGSHREFIIIVPTLTATLLSACQKQKQADVKVTVQVRHYYRYGISK